MKKVIIVGTGIVGATAAYELARYGIKVMMVDRKEEGRATPAAAGIINPWLTKRRNKAWYELATKGAAYYDELMESLATDGEINTGYKKVGALRLHTDIHKLIELEKIAKKRRETAPEIGKIKLLNTIETKKAFPLLDRKYYSLFISGGARVDGKALQKSLIRAAIKHGATFVEGNAQLTQYGAKITGIKLDHRSFTADATIVTNGIWMPELFLPLHVSLQISPQKGEIIHLQLKDIHTNSLPVIMPPNNQYILHFNDGRIVIGTTHEDTEEMMPHNSAGAIHYILDKALEIAPTLAKSIFLESRVGYRPYTPNHLPVFGSFPQFEQLLIANGLGASGLTTGPFIGNQLAKIVLNKTLDIDIEKYNVQQIMN